MGNDRPSQRACDRRRTRPTSVETRELISSKTTIYDSPDTIIDITSTHTTHHATGMAPRSLPLPSQKHNHLVVVLTPSQRAFTNPAPKVHLHLYPPSSLQNNKLTPPTADRIRPLSPKLLHLHALQQILLPPPRIRSAHLLLRPPTPQTPPRPKTALAGSTRRRKGPPRGAQSRCRSRFKGARC